jgi:hypothetical protein
LTNNPVSDYFTWGKYMTGKRILVFCDNEASVQILNSGHTRDGFMQKILRDICSYAANLQFEENSMNKFIFKHSSTAIIETSLNTGKNSYHHFKSFLISIGIYL